MLLQRNTERKKDWILKFISNQSHPAQLSENKWLIYSFIIIRRQQWETQLIVSSFGNHNDDWDDDDNDYDEEQWRTRNFRMMWKWKFPFSQKEMVGIC